MPVTKAAKKAHKRSAKLREVNDKVKTVLKNEIKKIKKTVKSGGIIVDEMVKKSHSAIDKAQQKGLLHKNTAARRKSQMAKAAQKIKKA